MALTCLSINSVLSVHGTESFVSKNEKVETLGTECIYKHVKHILLLLLTPKKWRLQREGRQSRRHGV